MVFTAHHNYKKWQKELNVSFTYFPFAIDNKVFNDYGMEKKYDFGFSGSLHKKWTDIRGRVKSKLFHFPKLIKSNDQRSNKFLKRPPFREKNIFWNEDPFNNYFGKKYSKLLNSSKVWLCTTSAINLVGTRFYEIMASKCLLFCNRSEAYNGLFNDGEHCIMFDDDLNDFVEKLNFYLDNKKEREMIINNAYEHVMKNHTWSNRIDLFTKTVTDIL
jgi:spore maturation protein CgeB